jgi:GTPase Era involved in 16S rRNA processing
LVLGSTGAGKSQLIDSLTKEVSTAIEAMNRTQFAESHRIRIDNQPFIFIDTPGQEHHQVRRRDEVRKALGQGISGVINVVSYGYHEWREAGDIPAFNTNGTINDDYLEIHRNQEINLLSEWTELLGDRETVDWLITVVTKADLWWDKRKEIMNYYQAGSYYNALGNAQSLVPIVLEYCSVFHKFYNQGRLCGTFDEKDKGRVRSHLLNQLILSTGRMKRHG